MVTLVSVSRNWPESDHDAVCTTAGTRLRVQQAHVEADRVGGGWPGVVRAASGGRVGRGIKRRELREDGARPHRASAGGKHGVARGAWRTERGAPSTQCNNGKCSVCVLAIRKMLQ